MSVVVISTVTFVLSTMPELTDNIDIMLFDNETENALNSTEVPLMAPVERWEEVGYEKFKMKKHNLCTCCLYFQGALYSREILSTSTILCKS